MSTRLEELTEQQKKLSSTAREKEKALVNTAADTNRQTITDDYNAQIATANQSYDELIDQNEVQKIINERKIAENMANMGLTDSGLNRTQMTAAQLSYSNNQAKINRQRQAAVDTLARAMNAQLAEVESNRAASLQSIDSTYDKQAVSNATSIYNTELEASAKAVSLSQNNASDKATARNTLISKLSDDNLSTAAKTAYYNSYVSQYGLDASDASVTTLLKNSGVMTDTSGNAQAWTNSDVETLSKMYYSHNVTDEAWNEYVAQYADSLGLSDAEAVQLAYAVEQNGKIRGTVNPSDLTYEVVNPKEKYDYTGDVANKVVVRDEYGVERTIENVYYNMKVYYAMEKYGNDWETHVNDSDIKKKAKSDIKEIQKTLGITK
nr:MAG TPA: hypothetical protein [Caudoviricetes sp.]